MPELNQSQGAEGGAQPCGGREHCGRFPFCGCGSADGLPERDPTKPAEQQGLFRKFEVKRTDGSDKLGGKHEGCEYFVLDIDHDKHAKAALTAYANRVEKTHPELAADMRQRYGLAPAPEGGDDDLTIAYMSGFHDGKKSVSVAPEGVGGVPEGWRLMLVESKTFDDFISAMDRAERKGYLPDAVVDEWLAFDYNEYTAAPKSDHEARYRFLIGLLIDRGVLTNKRYGNGTWVLRGIYGVDDSGLNGAGRTAEEAVDNAIIANQMDPAAAEKFWQATNSALSAAHLSRQAASGQPCDCGATCQDKSPECRYIEQPVEQVAGDPPRALPESMTRDEMLKYYSSYANLCAHEALRYQKRIRDLESALAASRTAEQRPADARQRADAFALIELHLRSTIEKGPGRDELLAALGTLFLATPPAEHRSAGEVLQRAVFERWANEDFHSGLIDIAETWDDKRGVYTEFAHHMAWSAWRHLQTLATQPATERTEDSALLDHLQSTGSSVEVAPFNDRWHFRVGGLHASAGPDLRASIRAALAQKEKQC